MSRFNKRKTTLVVFESRGTLWHHKNVFKPIGKVTTTFNKTRGTSIIYNSVEETVKLIAAVKPHALIGLNPDFCVTVGDLQTSFINQIQKWGCPVEELLIRNGNLCEMPKILEASDV